MKRERRQELKTNELSVQLQRFSEYIQLHASALIAVGIGVVLIVSVLLYRNQAAIRTNEEGWTALYDAGRVDRSSPDWVPKLVQRYRDISQAYDDPQLVLQARLLLGDFCLEEASKAEPQDLQRELLDTAEDTAQTLLTTAQGAPLKAAALNWLATVEENRFAVDHDPAHKARAREYLDRIRDGAEFRGTAFQADVLDRLNDYDSLWEPVVLADPPPPPPVQPEALPTGAGDASGAPSTNGSAEPGASARPAGQPLEKPTDAPLPSTKDTATPDAGNAAPQDPSKPGQGPPG